MNKINFDGRLLEGKNVERKIRDLANELDFSGNAKEDFYTFPKRNYYQKKSRLNPKNF